MNMTKHISCWWTRYNAWSKVSDSASDWSRFECDFGRDEFLDTKSALRDLRRLHSFATTKWRRIQSVDAREQDAFPVQTSKRKNMTNYLLHIWNISAVEIHSPFFAGEFCDRTYITFALLFQVIINSHCFWTIYQLLSIKTNKSFFFISCIIKHQDIWILFFNINL